VSADEDAGSDQDRRFRQAIEAIRQVFGDDEATRAEQTAARGYRVRAMDDFAALTLAHGFVDMWSRPGLDPRSRSIAQIAGLMCLQQWDQLEVHLGFALRAGLTPSEIMEVVLQMTVYGGQAMGNQVFRIANRVFAAAGIDERE
jgi:3-oxoadipate enol-lactonase/4-carboxymuconolactone decarboxylase